MRLSTSCVSCNSVLGENPEEKEEDHVVQRNALTRATIPKAVALRNFRTAHAFDLT